MNTASLAMRARKMLEAATPTMRRNWRNPVQTRARSQRRAKIKALSPFQMRLLQRNGATTRSVTRCPCRIRTFSSFMNSRMTTTKNSRQCTLENWNATWNPRNSCMTASLLKVNPCRMTLLRPTLLTPIQWLYSDFYVATNVKKEVGKIQCGLWYILVLCVKWPLQCEGAPLHWAICIEGVQDGHELSWDRLLSTRL